MQPAIRFVNSNNQYGLDALHEEAEDVNISREGETPIPATVDIENTMQVIEAQEACNQLMASQKRNHQSQVNDGDNSVSNNKHRKNNHYTQEQRDKVESALREHGDSWSAAQIARVANVPVSIVYSWKKTLLEKGSLQYCSNRNAYRKILTPDLEHKIATLIETKDNKMTEKEILENLRRDDPNIPQMSLSTLSHAFTRGEIVDENGVSYTLKRLTNRPAAANTEANKQLRIEVVSKLITYLERGYIWVSIDEVHFQVGPYRLYGRAPRGKKAIGNCMPARTDYSAITAIDSMGNKPLSLFVKGTVSSSIFYDHFRMLLSRYKGEKCIFFMDNASVHNKDDIQYLCSEAKQSCLFNAPYTPDLNPVEMFFAEWKKKVFREAPTLPSQDQFLRILKESFLSIEESTIRSSFISVQHKIFPKVIAKEDM